MNKEAGIAFSFITRFIELIVSPQNAVVHVFPGMIFKKSFSELQKYISIRTPNYNWETWKEGVPMSSCFPVV